MKFIEVDPSVIKMIEPRHTRGKVQRAVIRFMESSMQAAELVFDPGEYVSSQSASSAYSKAIRRLKADCKIGIRDGRVYIYKKEGVFKNG